MKVDIILASGSPRRRELMEREGVAFSVRVSQADETLDADLLRQPEEAAKKLAERKARAVVEDVLNEGYAGMAMVVGADTMVVADNVIYGKPVDEADAKRILGELSGQAHQVITGVSVWLVGAPEGEEDISLAFRSFAETSHVLFRELDDALIDAYIATGEPMDKAGAYGVQGKGGEMLVERVSGDFDNVVGLPVKRLIEEFSEFFEAAK
ncbi:MAG: septum formation protein Maf [Slackia piriformis]|uniref:dTTP/UTP pyrophosphatase n=1 Tax=Slackia piriformis TaxID=626934 RepID=A0A943UYI9_9ACTN|nr:septum formation protein Maf [Slackia piriformis]